ncbi:MAG: hypothetical protein M1834_000843 [Cirrosporium novae-zelandiae]|nr:MAG: hypothetical protein M1834_000843 [Cirrosporium novae-zelandiae]
MAQVSGTMLKRPHPEDEEAFAQKRSRSNNGSPAPYANASPAPPKDVSKMLEAARAKAAAIAARLQAARSGNSAPSGNANNHSPSPAPSVASSAMSRIEQMKARVAAATSKANTSQRTAPPTPTYQHPVYEDAGAKAHGGLDVGLHPALQADFGMDSRGGMHSKFATSLGNRRTESPRPGATKSKKQLDLSGPSIEETKANPYFDSRLGPQTATVRSRKPRQLVFNQKGKYEAQARALRRQAELEAMKKRIAAMSMKAGIDEDIDSEKGYLVEAPPVVEWWDEGLIDGPDYSSSYKINTVESIITRYIQHPVLLIAPQEKIMPPPKPMFLTKTEQAKVRRQRRMADLKEQQAKIRLGLEPAPAPKVKKSNLMRVLGEEAVKDPTAVEARVNREIAERKLTHEQANETRKLTKEQRHEKLATQQEKDAAKGVHMAVYKIDSLANGRHRFKISKNAEQNALTGICILSPKFNLVIVEGGSHSINFYKKLMLNRIDWTENPGSNAAVREGNKEAMAAWLEAEDEQGEPKDLSENKCMLVWEGEVKNRVFRKWGSRVCESDGQAREVLGRTKLENFWTLAKSLK